MVLRGILLAADTLMMFGDLFRRVETGGRVAGSDAAVSRVIRILQRAQHMLR